MPSQTFAPRSAIQQLGGLIVDSNDGNAAVFNLEGSYTLKAVNPAVTWYWSLTDGLDVGSMNEVAPGDSVDFTGPTTVYCKVDVTTTPITLNATFNAPLSGGLSQSQVDARIVADGAFKVLDGSGPGDVLPISASGRQLNARRLTAGAGIALDVGGGASGDITIRSTGSGGDSTQFAMKAAYTQANEAGYPAALIDPELQVPCVAGTYLVEAGITFADGHYTPGIACDVRTGGQQMAIGREAGPGSNFIGLKPTNDGGGVIPINNAFNDVSAGGGFGIVWPLAVGAAGVINIVGYVVASGAGTIAIIHCNQLGVAEPVGILKGSWLKVTKIG